MINSTQNNTSIYPTAYAATGQAVEKAPTQPQTSSPYGEAVTVSLSPAAEGAKTLASMALEITIDPAVHMERAQVELKAMMARLGMSADTDIDIEILNDGTISVEGDHPLVSKMEEDLNAGDPQARKLRNALIGAHTGSVMVHIGEAVSLAMQGADDNPSMMETYYGWVKTVADTAKNSSFHASFSNGEISGSLVGSDGKAYSPGDGLTLPA
ncbi:MAG: hypothetical protein V7740_07910 [Pseudomonas marincola]